MKFVKDIDLCMLNITTAFSEGSAENRFEIH